MSLMLFTQDFDRRITWIYLYSISVLCRFEGFGLDFLLVRLDFREFN